MASSNAKDKICVALDVSSVSEATSVVMKTSNFVGYYKIGLQLFCSEGPTIVHAVLDHGGSVFLDLKFHDIPNTVAGAVSAVASLGAKVLNVHASGGRAMMEAAAEAAKAASEKTGGPRPLVIGVTLLTSLNTTTLSSDLGINETDSVFAGRLATLSHESGLDGVVCSAHETRMVRREFGHKFFIVNPGIRPSWAVGKDDQKRITTPTDAINFGADLLVIGRPIVSAADQTEAAKRVMEEVAEAMKV